MYRSFFSFLNFLPFAFRELGYTAAEFGMHISLLPAGFVIGNLISRKWTAHLGYHQNGSLGLHIDGGCHQCDGDCGVFRGSIRIGVGAAGDDLFIIKRAYHAERIDWCHQLRETFCAGRGIRVGR